MSSVWRPAPGERGARRGRRLHGVLPAGAPLRL